MMHNISIATADDVTYFGDDVKYIPCILPSAIIIVGYCLNWLEKKTWFHTLKFCQFIVNWFGNPPMATECILACVRYQQNLEICSKI